MKKFFKFKKGKLSLIIIITTVFLFTSAITVYALNTWNEGYRINTETKEVKVDSSENCHKVTNTSGNSYFIPTKTTAEWNAFAGNLPSGVSIGSCDPVCVPGLCKLCPGPTVPADDVACGTIDCDGLNYYYTSGAASAAGTNYCKYRNYADITSNRCEGIENCKDANTSDCTSYGDSTAATCGICKYASGACSSCSNYANGTSCGSSKECDGSGNCVAVSTCTAGDYYDWTGACSTFCAGMGGSKTGVGFKAAAGCVDIPCDNTFIIFEPVHDAVECYSECIFTPQPLGLPMFHTIRVTMCRCSCP